MDRIISLATVALLVLFGASTLAGSGKGSGGHGAAGPVSSEQTGGASSQTGTSVKDILGDQDKDRLQDQARLHQDPDQLHDRDRDRDQLKDQDQDPDQDKDQDQIRDRLHQDSQ